MFHLNTTVKVSTECFKWRPFLKIADISSVQLIIQVVHEELFRGFFEHVHTQHFTASHVRFTQNSGFGSLSTEFIIQTGEFFQKTGIQGYAYDILPFSDRKLSIMFANEQQII